MRLLRVVTALLVAFLGALVAAPSHAATGSLNLSSAGVFADEAVEVPATETTPGVAVDLEACTDPADLANCVSPVPGTPGGEEDEAPVVSDAEAPNVLSARAAAKLTVSPSSNVEDGQTLTVNGSGYDPNTLIFVVLCANTSDDSSCDLNNIVNANSNGSGSFTASVTANKIPGCETACYVAAAAPTNPDNAGTARFTFASDNAGGGDDDDNDGGSGGNVDNSDNTTDDTSGDTAGEEAAVNAGDGGLSGLAVGGSPVAGLMLLLAGLGSLSWGAVRIVRTRA